MSLATQFVVRLYSGHPYFTFGVGIFLYTSLVAAIVQLFLLPTVFPALHAGHGLLLGGDWVGFHEIAVELAERVRLNGWSVWELSPAGHAPAGIAGAIYALTLPEPYVLIPLNAVIHSIAGMTLMRIARYLADNDGIALMAALPFVLYPSAMAWYTQIHKDGIYFAGAFLSLFGWIMLARLATWCKGWHEVVMGVLYLFAGIALMSLVRTYSFQVMQAMGYLIASGLAAVFIARGASGALQWKTCVGAIAILFIIPILLKYAPVDAKLSYEVVTKTHSKDTYSGDLAYAKDIWRTSRGLPLTLENRFMWLAQQRDNYILREPGQIARGMASGSLIDTDIRLSSAADFAAYLPRAIQIGLLAPFPKHWVEQGKSPGGSMMRRLAALEMIVSYVALMFIPYVMWIWRSRVELWLSVVFGISMILLYAYSTPNLGTLYRQRYGFLMLLVTMGFAGGLAALIPRVFRRSGTQ